MHSCREGARSLEAAVGKRARDQRVIPLSIAHWPLRSAARQKWASDPFALREGKRAVLDENRFPGAADVGKRRTARGGAASVTFIYGTAKPESWGQTTSHFGVSDDAEGVEPLGMPRLLNATILSGLA